MSQFSMSPSFSGVVKHLIIINFLMFAGTYILLGAEQPGPMFPIGGYEHLGRLSLAAFMPGSFYFQPYQMVTYMFMHSSPSHIIFNMLSLYMFGSAVEMQWGSKRFLIYYLSCAIGAYLLFFMVQWWELSSQGIDPMAWNIPMLGASGAIFGILAAFGILFANREVMLLFPPIPMKAKYLMLLMGAAELYYGVFKVGTGVAHFAHLGGAFTGIIIIFLWNRSR